MDALVLPTTMWIIVTRPQVPYMCLDVRAETSLHSYKQRLSYSLDGIQPVSYHSVFVKAIVIPMMTARVIKTRATMDLLPPPSAIDRAGVPILCTARVCRQPCCGIWSQVLAAASSA